MPAPGSLWRQVSIRFGCVSGEWIVSGGELRAAAAAANLMVEPIINQRKRDRNQPPD